MLCKIAYMQWHLDYHFCVQLQQITMRSAATVIFKTCMRQYSRQVGTILARIQDSCNNIHLHE
jgi:hypothetical protein